MNEYYTIKIELDLDSETRPMMKYVVMNCQRIPQISKASL